MAKEDIKETAQKIMAKVYKDGFNIYMCLAKLKKQLKLCVDFPPEAIIWTCEEYLRTKPNVKKPYPWFLRVFSANSAKYFSSQQERESQDRHRTRGGPMAQSIKDILKGM